MAGGWIGVDLDGTLAEYHGWNGGAIGPPIPAMVRRVRAWLEEGCDVRIVTARVAPTRPIITIDDYRALKAVEEPIARWCEEHIGKRLPITCMKDMGMVELWDDRAVQVIENTGMRADGGA